MIQPQIRTASIFPLALFVLAISLVSGFWIAAPFERDQSLYFVVGHELLKGRGLYHDLWDHKPPAIHLVYAVSQLLFGYSIVALWCLQVGLGLLGGYGLLIILRRKAPGTVGICTALTLWVLLFASPNLEATQPNTESFIVCCWIWFLVVVTGTASLLHKALAAGALLAAATLFKPIAPVFFIPSVILFLTQVTDRRAVAGVLVSLLLPTVCVWSALWGWFFFRGVEEAAFSALVVFNRAYAGDLLTNLGQLLSPRRLIPNGIASMYLPLCSVLAFSVIHIWRRYRSCEALFLSGSVCAAYITVALPGNFYLHYYQYLVPVLVLGSGYLVNCLPVFYGRLFLALTLSAALLVEGVTAISASWHHRHPRFAGTHNMQAHLLALELKSRIPPGEWFYEWGAQPALYIETDISPRHGALHADWLISGPVSAELTARTLKILKQQPPLFVILSVPYLRAESEGNPVLLWIREHYQPDNSFAESDSFQVMRRR